MPYNFVERNREKRKPRKLKDEKTYKTKKGRQAQRRFPFLSSSYRHIRIKIHNKKVSIRWQHMSLPKSIA